MLSGYAVVGGIGFLVDAGVLHFLLATAGIGPIGARLVSFPVALAVTFFLNRQLVFAGSRHSLAVAIPAYVGVQGVGYLVNMAIYSLLIFVAPWPLSNPLVSLAIASGIALVVNYIGARRIVFMPRATGARPGSELLQTCRTILRPDAVRMGAIVLTLPLLIFSVYFLVSYLSIGRDVETARRHILAAYESGDLVPSYWRDRGNTVIGEHQFNDCLILLMAIDQRLESRWQLAVSPRAPLAEGQQPCETLRTFAQTNQTEAGVQPYHRYLHAQTVLMRYILPLADIATIRWVFSSILSLLILAVAALAMFRLTLGDDVFLGLLFVSIGFGFARWFGFESFSQSLGHAPADAVAVAFALYLCVASHRGLSRVQLVTASTLFGCFTMLTEFLTGGLPLGLAMIIGIAPFVLKDSTDRMEIVVSAAAAAAAFVIAAGLCLVIKLAFATVVFGPEVIADFASSLERRTAGDPDPVKWLRKVIGGLSTPVGGLHYFMAGFGLFLAVAGGFWGWRKIQSLSSSEAFRTKATLLAGSNLVLLAWLMVFWQHTIQHAWFMDRIFVWTYCSGFALFAFGVVMSRLPREKVGFPVHRHENGLSRSEEINS
jgi:putative flippase GtrA